MIVPSEVQEYVARQPSLTWRRHILRWVIRTLGFKVLWNMEITGLDNIPTGGPSIIMMNHISLIDPVLCMGAVTQRFVIPMTKIENLENPLIAPFIRWWGAYSVKRGEIDRKALTNSIELVRSGQLILIAPEGTRHSDGLVEAKDGLAFIATKADAAIIPTGISGAVEWKDCLKQLRRPRIRIHFGRAFKFRSSGNGRTSRDVLPVMTREAMYQLALAIQDERLRGFYRDVSQATTEHIAFI